MLSYLNKMCDNDCSMPYSGKFSEGWIRGRATKEEYEDKDNCKNRFSHFISLKISWHVVAYMLG